MNPHNDSMPAQGVHMFKPKTQPQQQRQERPRQMNMRDLRRDGMPTFSPLLHLFQPIDPIPYFGSGGAPGCGGGG